MRNAIITGAGRGIGHHVALHLAAEPMRLVLVARSLDELRATASGVEARGGEAHCVTADLADPAQLEAAASQALELLEGRVDVLINNAGIFDMRPLDGLERTFWDRMLAINLTAPTFLTKACLPGLRASAAAGGSPALVNVSSIAGEQGFPDNSAYCASKYGLRGLSDALRVELEPEGIVVRTVYPGGTDTSIFDDVAGDWDRSTMARPEDVAALIASAIEPDAPDDLHMPA
ncbi:MAG: SDR family NAD(P)-dependent oxidoreductase [Planctomycetota bacterium]|nr:SDR family NAD(P)-dependent oxidoreductase [Planctomycetota bacterium]